MTQQLIRVWRKLRNNVFNLRVFNVLGLRLASLYVLGFFRCFLGIIRCGDLKPIDQFMGTKATSFNYRDNHVLYNCGQIDRCYQDGTFSFGGVRELVVRDCYFCHLPDLVYRSIGTVVDLGSNRGLLSTMLAPKADFVLAVEANSSLVPIIERNLHCNRAGRFEVVNSFVGSAGRDFTSERNDQVSLTQLLDGYPELAVVDFLKIDIEGSEFSLFSEASWLPRVKALSMEVHPQYGDPEEILRVLEAAGFEVRVADEDLVLAESDRGTLASFIYAWR